MLFANQCSAHIQTRCDRRWVSGFLHSTKPLPKDSRGCRCAAATAPTPPCFVAQFDSEFFFFHHETVAISIFLRPEISLHHSYLVSYASVFKSLHHSELHIGEFFGIHIKGNISDNVVLAEI